MTYHERRQLETGMDRWLDRKITLGNLITLAVLLVSFLYGYAKLTERVERISFELNEHKSQQMNDVNSYVRRDVQETRNRFIDSRLEDIGRKLDTLIEEARRKR